MNSTPTSTAYNELQAAFDFFNQHLFDGSLPACLITLQREKTTYGYYSAARFANRSGDTVDEIALNPTYFGITPIIETLQTLAHEMTHLWQQHRGKPGRGRYHNQEWAEKMEAIGLMPSSTGQPGGARTGDHMADYPIEGGRFLQACKALLTNEFSISWYDRFPPTEVVSNAVAIADRPAYDLPATALSVSMEPQAIIQGAAAAGVQHGTPGQRENRSNRLKYSCPGCQVSVWGKPGLRIACADCDVAFVEQL